jgi:hypothetical protein
MHVPGALAPETDFSWNNFKLNVDSGFSAVKREAADRERRFRGVLTPFANRGSFRRANPAQAAPFALS